MNQPPAPYAATDGIICISWGWEGWGRSFIKILFCSATADHHAVSRRTLCGVHSGRNCLSKCFCSRMTKQTSDKCNVLCWKFAVLQFEKLGFRVTKHFVYPTFCLFVCLFSCLSLFYCFSVHVFVLYTFQLISQKYN